MPLCIFSIDIFLSFFFCSSFYGSRLSFYRFKGGCLNLIKMFLSRRYSTRMEMKVPVLISTIYYSNWIIDHAKVLHQNPNSNNAHSFHTNSFEWSSCGFVIVLIVMSRNRRKFRRQIKWWWVTTKNFAYIYHVICVCFVEIDRETHKKFVLSMWYRRTLTNKLSTAYGSTKCTLF